MEVGKPSWNAAQPCARAQGCVNDELRADGLRKGWHFRVGTWNVDSLTGRSGEVVEALNTEDAMVRSRWRKQIEMIDDHNECEWVNVSSGTGSAGLSRTNSTEP